MRAATSEGEVRLRKMTAGVSGSSFPPFQSMPHAFRPALRRLRVSLELPEKTSMMNGRPAGLMR